MKFKKLHYISTLLLAGIVALVMMSNSMGITGQSTAGCTCHGNGNPSVATIISVTGLPANYVNGNTYNLTLTVTNAGQTGALARAGFDMTVNSGSFTATAPNTVASSTTELRHSSPRALVSGTTSWTFNWTAPATGAAQATFNIACNATNGNSAADAGDFWNTATINVQGPAAVAPTVVVGTPSGITATAATINATVNANGSNTSSLSVQYGLTTSYGSTGTITPNPVTGSTAVAVTSALGPLTPATLYHYRIVATNAGGTTTSNDFTFTTLAAVNLPTVTVGAPTGITNSGATVNGTVNANNGSTSVTVEYGLTIAYGSAGTVTPGTVTGSTAVSVSAALAPLAAATTYHYRIVATNSAGTTTSPDNTFTTLASVTTPTITVGTPTGITFNAATINGTVNANGGSTGITVEYGTTTGYGSIGTVVPGTVTGITPSNISSALAGLAPATLYHYRIVATNSAGVTNSPDNTFTTAVAPTAPTISIITPTAITSNSATVRATVNANNATAIVTMEYGLTTGYGSNATVSPSAVTGNIASLVTSPISGLLPLTTYHYRFIAVNSAGTTTSADNTFTTLTNVLVPTIVIGTVTGLTQTTATVNGTVNANNGNATISIEYGLTTGYGSTIGATPSTATGNTPTPFSGAIGGLSAGTTYHYRVVATNSSGTTNSPDNTFTTIGIPGLPIIVLGAPSGITSSSANISASVDAVNANTTVSVEYGLTTAYGSTVNTSPAVVSGNTLTPVGANLTGLAPLTTYHYRVKAVNSVGTVTSADATFTTTTQFSPADIVLGAPSNISYNRGVVNATVNANNSNTSVVIEYGTTTAYGNSINAAPAQVFGTTPTAIVGIINQLQPNTLYHYRVTATNAWGTISSTDDVFSTIGLSVANLEQGGFHLFPNPAKDQLTLTTREQKDLTITGTSMDGRAVSLPYHKVAQDQYLIDVAHLPMGIYLIILNSEGQTFTSRFSKL